MGNKKAVQSYELYGKFLFLVNPISIKPYLFTFTPD